MQVLSMQYARNKKKSPPFNFGAKNTFLVYLPYLLNHLELSAHILTQGRSCVELVPSGGFVHFGLESSIFGAKAAFLVHLPYHLDVALPRLP